MNPDDDIFIFPSEDDKQLNLDFGSSTMDDTITIKLDDLMTTSTAGSILTTNGTGLTGWSLPSSLGSGGYTINNGGGGYTISATPSTPALSTSISAGGTTTWNTSPYTYNDTITLGDYKISAGNDALNVTGDANFQGDIKLKGKSLTEVLDNIEQRLAILRPNPKLEEKWEKLKELGDEYRRLEKEILEGEQIWDILKK